MYIDWVDMRQVSVDGVIRGTDGSGIGRVETSANWHGRMDWGD